MIALPVALRAGCRRTASWTGRIWFSTQLLSAGKSPSSMYRMSACQRPMLQSIALAVADPGGTFWRCAISQGCPRLAVCIGLAPAGIDNQRLKADKVVRRLALTRCNDRRHARHRGKPHAARATRAKRSLTSNGVH